MRKRFLAAYEADAASGDQASPRSQLQPTQNNDARHASWRRMISAGAKSLYELKKSLPDYIDNILEILGGDLTPSEDQIRIRLLPHLDADAELRNLKPSLYSAQGQSYKLLAGNVPPSTIRRLHESVLINTGFSPGGFF